MMIHYKPPITVLDKDIFSAEELSKLAETENQEAFEALKIQLRPNYNEALVEAYAIRAEKRKKYSTEYQHKRLADPVVRAKHNEKQRVYQNNRNKMLREQAAAAKKALEVATQ